LSKRERRCDHCQYREDSEHPVGARVEEPSRVTHAFN
jgi:hypothetical protein